ncbi:hypothetical protein [Tessaracoccus coleopterorum]|uniref:hypothetical protein n=1 Tax=Tessaracoccus coleopterorum TaxID=2714950 RepID=UPI001E2CD2B8|nr:hypothetical protein [Tessaracoccus coleopterorum]
MYKLKHERTADCVVAGYRLYRDATDAVGSLLLGLYDDEGLLNSVGAIGAFPMARRRELFDELQPLVTGFDAHPWAWAEPEEKTPDNRDQSFPRTPPPRHTPDGTRRRTCRSSRCARARGGGPLRAHGGCAVPAPRAVQPLA